MRDLNRFGLGDFDFPLGKKPIASGGRGNIYRVVAKRMLSPEVSGGATYLLKRPKHFESGRYQARLTEHLEVVRRRLWDRHRTRFQSRLALPLGLVQKPDDAFVGYLMPEFNEGCFFTKTHFNGENAPALQQVNVFLNSFSERQLLGTPTISMAARFSILHDFVYTLSLLHENDLIVGDISGANLLVQHKPGKRASHRAIFLDVDSFRAPQSEHPSGAESTIFWRSPEELEDVDITPSAKTDSYKAALLIVRLLAQGGVEDRASFDIVDSDVSRQLLVEFGGVELSQVVYRCMDPDPSRRPPSAQLGFYLEKARDLALERLQVAARDDS